MKQLLTQLKGRDKLIDELYKSAYVTINGVEARNNIPNKDVLLIINLKKEVCELKDTIYAKDDELAGVRMTMKATKVVELESELRLYA